MTDGAVQAIFVAPEKEAPMVPVAEALALPGGGLSGDRYGGKRGTWSAKSGGGRDVTVIEAEALDLLRAERGVELLPRETRRNLLTRGVRLNDLVGREFRIGGAVLAGVRLCEPCAHLERLTGKPVLAGLVGRGGLRCDVVAGGRIRAGDSIEILQVSGDGRGGATTGASLHRDPNPDASVPSDT